MLYCMMSCDVTLYDVMRCDLMSGHVISCHVMPSTDHNRKIAEISMTILPNVQGVEALRSRAGLPDTWKWRRDVRSVAYTHVSLCVVCMNMCRYVPLFTAPHTANSSSALHATPYTTLHNTPHTLYPKPLPLTSHRTPFTPLHCSSPHPHTS